LTVQPALPCGLGLQALFDVSRFTDAAASDAAAGGEGEKEGAREGEKEGGRGSREEHPSDEHSLVVNAQQASSLGVVGDWAEARALLASQCYSDA